ncbi:hypothetical protein H181DRAFT_04542 [Streptomyces sp. WMMB 714]|nr:hypothetical protein H181DRAFT_04542 [Streptomyces sp. WMMB 714]
MAPRGEAPPLPGLRPSGTGSGADVRRDPAAEHATEEGLTTGAGAWPVPRRRPAAADRQ